MLKCPALNLAIERTEKSQLSFIYCLSMDILCVDLKVLASSTFVDKERKNILKTNKKVGMLLAKRELIKLKYIGKSKNYYEDIYIPP